MGSQCDTHDHEINGKYYLVGNNYFENVRKIYRQRMSTDIETKFAPAVVNIFMSKLEKRNLINCFQAMGLMQMFGRHFSYKQFFVFVN